MQTYDQIYTATVPLVNITNAMNYSSPILHTVVLDNLEPNSTYYYSIMGDSGSLSETFSFRSLAPIGEFVF